MYVIGKNQKDPHMCIAEEFDQDENASALHSNSSARGVRLTPTIQMSDSTFPPYSIFDF